MMCIFVVLCVDESLFYMPEYSDAIKLPKSINKISSQISVNFYT